MTRISVALCTHNGARFVEQQVASILAQSRLPDQLVVSDDASTDDTIAIVERLVAPSPVELVVLRNEVALGYVANFEQALRATDGELVALSDQDDSWHPDRIEAAAAFFEADPELLMVHSDAVLVDEHGAGLGHTLFDALGVTAGERAEAASGDELAVLLRRNLVTGATAMFRRRAVDLAVPFPDHWVHDEWLAMIATSVGRGMLLDEPLVDYRQHGSNQIGVTRLGLRGKIGRILEPRSGRNVYLASRAAVLVDRLEALGADVRPDALARAREKLAHLRVREAFSRHRIARLVPVLREAATGRYGRYSRGGGDILRDLLQPAGDED
jgi:glycosyltransferase involved in cell wall biosynthesis